MPDPSKPERLTDKQLEYLAERAPPYRQSATMARELQAWRKLCPGGMEAMRAMMQTVARMAVLNRRVRYAADILNLAIRTVEKPADPAEGNGNSV